MKRYPKELREQVFEQYLCGLTAAELSEGFAISTSTIYTWIRSWKRGLADKPLSCCSIHTVGTVIASMEEQRRKVDEAEQTLAIIHESGILQTIPLKERIKIALAQHGIHRASIICSALEINAATLAYHKRADMKRQQKNHLCNAIRSAFEASGGRIGSERIRIQLQEQGIQVSKKRIIRLMHEMSLAEKAESIPYYPFEENSSPTGQYNVKIL